MSYASAELGSVLAIALDATNHAGGATCRRFDRPEVGDNGVGYGGSPLAERRCASSGASGSFHSPALGSTVAT
jgi:hypothetical protein